VALFVAFAVIAVLTWARRAGPQRRWARVGRG